MVSPTRWTWIWLSSRSWWWTGRPGVLQSMGSQSQTHLSDWTELMCIRKPKNSHFVLIFLLIALQLLTNWMRVPFEDHKTSQTFSLLLRHSTCLGFFFFFFLSQPKSTFCVELPNNETEWPSAHGLCGIQPTLCINEFLPKCILSHTSVMNSLWHLGKLSC